MNVLKIPEGCLRRSSDLSLRNEVLVYYKLKSVIQHGYFEFGVGVRLASEKMCLSERTVRRYFQQLYACGMMYKDTNGYGLIKYDKLYGLLGYDMSYNSKNGRLGKFKIFKISVKHTDNLITAIAREEIILNQSRQEYMIKRKLTPTTNPDSIVGVVREVSLSCAGVGRLLGLSRSTGHRIENNLVRIFPNTIKIDRHVQVVGVSENKASPGSGTYKSNGLLFKVMNNRIYIH